MSVITVDALQMTYKTSIRIEGVEAAFSSLFRRRYQEIQAVQQLSFSIEEGTIAGFIGPNGAGKTTTLKLLTGILHPTSGSIEILGRLPWKREPAFLKQIALIRGSQPIGGPTELTVLDSLRFQQLLYEVSEPDFHKNLAELAEMLDLETLLQRQIRTLSLGERMRCGLALSLLYRPRILFLDEPTLGLDVTAVNMMRGFIVRYNQQTGATILLTSHYMVDVETLCKRVLLIDHGKLTYDGSLTTLSTTLSPYKLLKVSTHETNDPSWSDYGEVIEMEAKRACFRVHRAQVPTVVARLLAEIAIADLTIEEPPLEHVIDQVYREGLPLQIQEGAR